ncbi:uncharacterized protein LOC126671004 [Mercurialis annua]|uniref:uncharacterized protein LOC126671004 n=1 Tax=Mercurialis annua TaxID=3986 RepID=UPI00215EFDD6|nr:uncharacterized protein LOC126671004 [Mercurialis annua]
MRFDSLLQNPSIDILNITEAFKSLIFTAKKKTLTFLSHTHCSRSLRSLDEMSSISETSRVMENATEELLNLPPTKVRGNCKHGRLYLYTSWTQKNPGRRFWRCSKYKTDDCGAFQWYDGEPSAELFLKIGYLLEQIKLLNGQVRNQEILIAEKDEQLARIREAQQRAAITFEKLIDDRDRLIEENRKLKSDDEDSQSCGRFCNIMLLFIFFMSFMYLQFNQQVMLCR